MKREPDTHVWISNTAFARLTGFVKVCLNCKLALEKGERLVERTCPGKPEATR
jgi:hypothetical protein